MTEKEIMEKLHRINLEMLHCFDRVCINYDIKYCLAYGSLLGAVRHKGFIPWDDDVDVWMTRDNYQKLLQHKEEFGEEYEFITPESFGENKYFEMIPRLFYKYGYYNRKNELCDYYKKRVNAIGLDIYLIDKTKKGIGGIMQSLELGISMGLMRSYAHPGKSRANFFGYKFAEFILGAIGKHIPLASLMRHFEKVALRYQTSPHADYYFNSVYFGRRVIYPAKDLEKIIRVDFEDGKFPIPSGADEILTLWYGDYMKLPPVEKRILHWGTDFIDADRIVFLK